MFFKKKKEITEPDEITGKRVLVIGAGRSGIGSVRLLNQVGAHPVLLEENDKRTTDEIRQSLSYDDRDVTEIVVGRLDAETANTIDLVVPSPGVPAEAPVLNRFALNGVKIISEVELAYRYMKGKLVAITGTNGKTTTTTLVYEILKQNWQYGAEEVFLVSDIGESFAAHALETTEKSVTVAEISSFQLEHIDRFRADVSAILNITPDHLDRYHTMENYARIKERITNRQTRDNKKEKFTNLCVLNADDPLTNDFGTNRCKAGVLWFSTQDEVPILAYVLKGDDIFFRIDKYSTPDEFVMHFSDCRLKDLCNAENVMAAIAITRCLGVEESRSVPVVREFKPVAHRSE